MPAYEKMSKSRGNVVTVDEVVYGVADWDQAFEFRDTAGQVIHPRELEVWRDKAGDGCFYTSTRLGRRPVFLHERGNPVPGLLLTGDREVVQHGHLSKFWLSLARRYAPDMVKDDGGEEARR